MSQRPISRSADLTRLRDEGYTVRIVGGYLVIDDVPFVDGEGVVHADGSLIMPLTLAGDVTTQPSDHTAWFGGGVPCLSNGQPLASIINQTKTEDLGDGLTTECYLSAKPAGSGRYDDYHRKVTTYVGYIAGQAEVADPDSTARRYRPTETDGGASTPFRYVDTAASRAGITALNALLSDERIGIVGLGGTGAYILDLIAKTHVADIHLFDGDDFLTHNAFRAPGAPSIDQLMERPLKVNHFGDIYDRMRNGIHRHAYSIDEDNIAELSDMTFVFIAIDDAEAKGPIVKFLIESTIPFVDVGMGVELVDCRLMGIHRTTLVTPGHDAHAPLHIASVSVRHDEDEYRSNIQIAELNMANASQAVIAWKKYREFYADWDHPHHMMYSIASNRIANDEYGVNPRDELDGDETA